MPKSVSTRCPKCKAKLKLKSRKAVGKKVFCPKCGDPFIVRVTPGSERDKVAAPDEVGSFEDPDPTGEILGGGGLPPITLKRASDGTPRPLKFKTKKAEAEDPRFGIGALFSAAVWWNAHIAVGVCLVDSAIDLLWLVTHWNEVYQQAGLGRFAVRRIGRPLFVIVTALIVWFQGVLPRDIGMRPVVTLFGGGYLFFFGLIAFVVGILAESVYERPIYAIQWSVVYMGVSLLAYALWGFGPETALQRAERLMAAGRFDEALTAVNQVLEEDPGSEDAEELERALQDMMRFA